MHVPSSNASRHNLHSGLAQSPIADIASSPPGVSVGYQIKRLSWAILWYVVVPGLFLLGSGGLSLLLSFTVAFTAQPGVYANPEVLDAARYATLSWLVGVISSIWFGRRILAVPSVLPKKLVLPVIGLLLAVVFFGHALVILG